MIHDSSRLFGQSWATKLEYLDTLGHVSPADFLGLIQWVSLRRDGRQSEEHEPGRATGGAPKALAADFVQRQPDVENMAAADSMAPSGRDLKPSPAVRKELGPIRMEAPQAPSFEETHSVALSAVGKQRILYAECLPAIGIGKVARGAEQVSLAILPMGPAQVPSLVFRHEQPVDRDGFSLNAAVSCKPYQRERLERLCRYITRPAICLDRLNVNNHLRNGATHILFSPLDFLGKLAALIPRPRHHLVRYHGIFAPNARIRKRIVPTKGKKTKTRKKSDKGEYKAETVAKVDDELIAPLSWAQRLI